MREYLAQRQQEFLQPAHFNRALRIFEQASGFRFAIEPGLSRDQNQRGEQPPFTLQDALILECLRHLGLLEGQTLTCEASYNSIGAQYKWSAGILYGPPTETGVRGVTLVYENCAGHIDLDIDPQRVNSEVRERFRRYRELEPDVEIESLPPAEFQLPFLGAAVVTHKLFVARQRTYLYEQASG